MNEEKGAPAHNYRNLYKPTGEKKTLKMIKVLVISMSRNLESSIERVSAK